MDMAIHWGVLRHLRQELGARSGILVTAIILDLIVLTGFLWIKLSSDPLVVGVACAVMAAILLWEFVFLRNNPIDMDSHDHG